MGQKVHPIGFRLGVASEWESKWFASGKEYAKNLHEDIALRKYIAKKWENAGISRIEIERVGHVIRFTVWTSRPGVVIGRGGAEIQVMKDELQAKTGAKIMINVQEIKNPDVVSQLVAVGVASALERRVSFRRAMKQSIQRAMRSGAKGMKAKVSGRLGGADIARSEHYHEGSIPLQTLRANIDYGFAEAKTTYGRLGVKVWIYKGQILPKAKKPAVRATEGGK